MIHNTPFGDIVDTEDDLQPYLYKGIEKAIRVFCILNAVIRTMKVEEDTLKDVHINMQLRLQISQMF